MEPTIDKDVDEINQCRLCKATYGPADLPENKDVLLLQTGLYICEDCLSTLKAAIQGEEVVVVETEPVEPTEEVEAEVLEAELEAEESKE